MSERRKKVVSKRMIAVVVVLFLGVSGGVGIRQLRLERVFSVRQGLAETQSAEPEKIATGDTAPDGNDPVQRFLTLFEEETTRVETGRPSLESLAGRANVRLVLMVLITLGISMFGILASLFANARALKVAKTASEAIEAALSESEKHRVLQMANKVDALRCQFGQFEANTGLILERMSKLEMNLHAVKKDIQENSTVLTKVGEDLEQFRQFRSDVEEIHRRLADAFAVTWDMEVAAVAVADEQKATDLEEDMPDAYWEIGESADRYNYPLAS